MPTYSFDEITPAEAVAFRAGTDSLSFRTDVTPISVGVSYRAPTTAAGGGAASVDLTVGGRTVSLSGNAFGLTSAFSNGGTLFLGGTASDSATGSASADHLQGGEGADTLAGLDGGDLLVGGSGDDSLGGGAGDDSLAGGDGVDRLVGGTGADSLEGGVGLDIFEFGAGDSPWLGLIPGLDRISDFDADLLIFRGGATPMATNYIKVVNPGAADPRALAQELFAAGLEYIVIRAGPDLEVFAPRIEIRVTLKNTSINAINLTNIRSDLAPATATSADDLLAGRGNDTIDGLAGADTIVETSGVNYLRGGDGGDSIAGGSGFDDANGNMGDDTVATGAGDDYCVGGKDNDVLSGGADYDLVYGNLGADTCDGGDGNDIVRGGQDGDLVMGGAGNDFVSGDKGNDTMTGGGGADIFHTFGDAGLDRVTDFSLAQGDRVQLDPGTVFTVSQVGADTVIDMTGGGRMVLVGVTMSTLTPGWIFGA